MLENESNLQNKLKLIKALQCNDIFTSNKISVKKHSFWQGHVQVDSGTAAALIIFGFHVHIITDSRNTSWDKQYPPPPPPPLFVVVAVAAVLKLNHSAMHASYISCW